MKFDLVNVLVPSLSCSGGLMLVLSSPRAYL
jgi:hypothetical protein